MTPLQEGQGHVGISRELDTRFFDSARGFRSNSNESRPTGEGRGPASRTAFSRVGTSWRAGCGRSRYCGRRHDAVHLDGRSRRVNSAAQRDLAAPLCGSAWREARPPSRRLATAASRPLRRRAEPATSAPTPGLRPTESHRTLALLRLNAPSSTFITTNGGINQ